MAKKDELEFEGGIDSPSKPKTEGAAGCHGQNRKELR